MPVAGSKSRPPEQLADYLNVVEPLGIERFVLVQPTAYGSDNSCLLDSLRALGPDRARGVVVPEGGPSADSLTAWHDVGVRAMRIVGFAPGQAHRASSPPSSVAGSDLAVGRAEALRPRIELLDSVARTLGWHLDFLLPGELVTALLPTFRRLTVDFTLAHLGLFAPTEGGLQPGFRELLDFVQNGSGRCWLKLTAAYRIATTSDASDVAPMVAAAVEAAPNRLIWGTDYPHLAYDGTVGTLEQLSMLLEWVPDERTRERILVDNPVELFGFA